MKFSKKIAFLIGIVFSVFVCTSCSANSKSTEGNTSLSEVFSTDIGCTISNSYYFRNFEADPDQILVFNENSQKVEKIFDLNDLKNPPTELADSKGLELKHFIENDQNLFLFIRDFYTTQTSLYSCKLDGSDVIKLADIPNSYSILNSALQGNFLFFTSVLGTKNSDAGGSTIYRFDLENKQLKPISNESGDQYKCPQIVDIENGILLIREDVMTRLPSGGFAAPYTTMKPAMPTWYVYIDHTNLLSYDSKKDEIISNAENLYLYSSIYHNNKIYYVDRDMKTIRETDWKGTQDEAIYTAENTIEFNSFPLEDCLIYVSLDSLPQKAGESTVYSYNLFDTQKRTVHEMNMENNDIAYVCSYAQLKDGYVLAIYYNEQSSTYMRYAYVAKEDLDDFENKMVILDYNI